MTFNDFIGKVQARARLGKQEDAVRATRATLTTLGERLFGNTPEKLASELPDEIALYLTEIKEQKKYDLDEFFVNVSKIENRDLPDAVQHSRAVITTLNDAVSAGEFLKIKNQLPEEYNTLFEAGIEGQLK
jgi:uncharacterized protein (DUF2267 family)